MGLSAADAPAKGGMCQNSVTRAGMHQHVNFSARSKIGVCGHVGRYFPAMVPSEGRSEGGAPVGVLFGRSGGRQKILPVKVADGKMFRRWFDFC